jgi:hypothetical protein
MQRAGTVPALCMPTSVYWPGVRAGGSAGADGSIGSGGGSTGLGEVGPTGLRSGGSIGRCGSMGSGKGTSPGVGIVGSNGSGTVGSIG